MFREIWLTPLVSVVQSVNLDSITAAAALGERRLVLFASTIHYPNHCSIQGILRCLDSYFTKFHCCTLPLRFNNFHSIRTLIVNNLSEFAVRCFEPSNCGGKMFVRPRFLENVWISICCEAQINFNLKRCSTQGCFSSTKENLGRGLKIYKSKNMSERSAALCAVPHQYKGKLKKPLEKFYI